MWARPRSQRQPLPLPSLSHLPIRLRTNCGCDQRLGIRDCLELGLGGLTEMIASAHRRDTFSEFKLLDFSSLSARMSGMPDMNQSNDGRGAVHDYSGF
jgi:hypothetical protein